MSTLRGKHAVVVLPMYSLYSLHPLQWLTHEFRWAPSTQLQCLHAKDAVPPVLVLCSHILLLLVMTVSVVHSIVKLAALNPSWLSCRYMRCFNLPGNAPPQILAIAPGPGILLAHSWKSLAIHAYTVNGRHMATAEGTEKLSAFAVSADGRFLVTGGVKGIITLRWIHSLQVSPSHCCSLLSE